MQKDITLQDVIISEYNKKIHQEVVYERIHLEIPTYNEKNVKDNNAIDKEPKRVIIIDI